MDETLMTDAQLADRWQTSRGTLANARSRGDGCPYLKLGGLVRYALSDVVAYEQQCRRLRLAHHGMSQASDVA
jgi:hypothetical protein